MQTIHKQWDAARLQYHNLRESDKHAALFKCFTCNCWFDGQYQLDHNFNVMGTEIHICPIAQAMMFDL